MDDASFGRLMALAQAGDRNAYSALLHGCQDWLKSYFARRVPPPQLDDLVQETLMSVHLKRASYDCSRPFLPWLAAIARYRWVDHLRRAYRMSEAESRAEGPLENEAGADGAVDRLALDKMMNRLPVKQAEAIRLTKIEELSVSEAAGRCGQSEALIKANVHRGMKRLHKYIESA